MNFDQAFEQPLKRLDPLPDRLRIGAKRNFRSHPLQRFGSSHLDAKPFRANRRARNCYLGRIAIGIKGWIAQRLGAKPLVRALISDQRTGTPNGI